MARMESTIRRSLQSEVTCPLCLGIFTDPKRLPCEHVYCKQCLRGLALRSITGKNISCPECRRDILIPNNDVANFPTPHQVNRLIEMHLKSAKTEAVTPQPAAATCKLHNSQSLDLYCETCRSLVCGHCIAKTCAKKNHKYGFVNEMVEKYQADLNRELEPVKRLHLEMSGALDIISETALHEKSKKKTKLQQIESTFDALSEVLERERKYFKESVEKTFQENGGLNSSKKNKISKTLEEIKSLTNYIEVASLQESKPEFLSSITGIRQRIRNLDTYSRSLQLEPASAPEMEVELLDTAELEDLCKARNFMYQKGDVLKGHTERLIDLTNVPVYETVEVLLNLKAQDVKKSIRLAAGLHSCHDNTTKVVNIKKASLKRSTLSFTPKQRGAHKLFIKHNDGNICGTPLLVYATIEPRLLASNKPLVTELHGVVGIKCHQGRILASKFGEGIAIMDSLTKLTERTIAAPGVNEVATDGIYIYATDIALNRIVKMTLNGTVVKTTGGEGDTPGNFNLPNGIRLSKDDKLYVCDTRNGRLQVFDKDLKFEGVLGRKGSDNCCFDCPDDLDFDDAGNLYIVDRHNHRIQVLTPQGQHIRNIGRHGSRLGELSNPTSAAIHRNMIYVTESKKSRISVFKLTGKFVAAFGEGILTHPECIAIDDNGYIHVSDSISRVVTF